MKTKSIQCESDPADLLKVGEAWDKGNLKIAVQYDGLEEVFICLNRPKVRTLIKLLEKYIIESQTF